MRGGGERDIHLQYQGDAARLWTLERRNGLARGIKNGLYSDGRFTCRAILNEAKFRLTLC